MPGNLGDYGVRLTVRIPHVRHAKSVKTWSGIANPERIAPKLVDFGTRRRRRENSPREIAHPFGTARTAAASLDSKGVFGRRQ
jgi:hypothetical protein